ncbi:MAG: choice-of-anchor B family protein [Rhodothermales bacterium]
MTTRISIFLILFFVFASSSLHAQDKHKKSAVSSAESTAKAASQSIRGARVDCQDGFAGEYPCLMTDLMSFVNITDLLAGLETAPSGVNDIWGWTDSATGREFAIVGLNTGTSFVEITDAENPVTLGFLKTHTPAQVWRDIKVYNNHAFIVADASGAHGMQVFDLTELLSVSSPPQLFAETAHYDTINSAHNIVINEDTGFAYLVGGSSGGETCGGGLHMVNIQDPLLPTFAGCFSSGYTHDAQCVVYNGPDADHQGKEICVESSVKDVVISDVTDKSNAFIIGAGTYPTVEYAHQGWLTDDHRYFIQGDELDEGRRGNNTKTIIWDFIDLDDPVVLTEFIAETPVIDHNLYIIGDYTYQSNYYSGLRILDTSDPASPVEVAFFDTVPNAETVGFGDGSWSNYPYYDSEVIAVSSQQGGLFVLKSNAVETTVELPELPAQLTLSAPYPNPFDVQTSITLTVDKAQQTEVVVYDMLGRQVAVLFDGMLTPDSPQAVSFEGKNLPNGKYIVRATGDSSVLSRIVTLIR